MADRTIQVSENVAEFIGWVNTLKEDDVRAMIREELERYKEMHDVSGDSRIDEGYMWDDILLPNDGDDQWKQGGDCNLCRKVSYCMKTCRANKLLKKITTPFLYQKYLDGNPEAVVKNGNSLDTESLMKQLGVLQ